MHIVRNAVLGIFVISVALLFVCPGLFGQTQRTTPSTGKGSIEGKISVVSGEGVSNSVPGIDVKLKGKSPGTQAQATTTDADGHYEFTNLGPASYMLEATVVG